MYVGLNLTYASSFQMLRGSVIIFTGLLSVTFLQRTLEWMKWCGIAFILVGLGIVGTSDLMNNDATDGYGQNNIITGTYVCLDTGSMMCIDHKFVCRRPANCDGPNYNCMSNGV